MRLGAFLPPWGPAAGPAGFDLVAAAVEDLGFDSLWIGDHAVLPRVVDSRYPYNEAGRSPFDPDQPLFEPLTLLAYLAARTRRVRLGVSVLVLPMRHPVLVARMLACVDALAAGRLVVGVGAGWMREEFEALDADFEARGLLTDQYICRLRELWREHPALGTNPRPEPLPPIIVGGNSGPALRRAALLGDGWHAIRTPALELARAVERLESLLVEAGRPRSAFQVVYRGEPPETGVAAELAHYREAGVDEFVVELPDRTPQERVEGLAAVARAYSP